MPAYDGSLFQPPAPTTLVVVRSPASGVTIQNVPMLLDTGADVSLVPRSYIGELINNVPDLRYELEAFDGTRSFAQVVSLEIEFLHKLFRGQFPVIEGPYGVLGRNVLNALSLNFDGPSLSWSEKT